MHSAEDRGPLSQATGEDGAHGAPSVVLVGTSFKTADIASRERIARRRSVELPSEFRPGAGDTTEWSVLETCNRFEVYLASRDATQAADSMIGKLAGPNTPRECFYVETGSDAIRHLFRVAAGLDSVVVGEEQILEQVRDAGKTARASGQAKSILSPLFDAAYSSGKRVRESYKVSELKRSVSAFALGRALHELGRAPENVLLIGSGETAKLAALRLKGSTVYLLSARKAVQGRFPNAIRVSRRELRKVMAKCDLVIAATRHRGYVLTKRDVQGGRGAVILDLGFPRNVDPSVKRAKSVRLYDLDDIAAWARSARRDGLGPAERMADEEAQRFNAWLTASRLTPTLANIFRWAERIRDEETAAALRKLPELSPHEREVVEALSKRLTGKLLSPHTSFVKGVGNGTDQRERLLLLESIFRDGSN
ncbi:MAG TPA: glutamyl-tRNA reductase [Nitrososphaerales archaeon]|nr:glutamyl-tRNA reductase [Nitrososphaerales archaeon]